VNSIFSDSRRGSHDGVRVHVVITVGDGNDAETTTFAERLDPTGAALLVDVVRQHLAVEGGGR